MARDTSISEPCISEARASEPRPVSDIVVRQLAPPLAIAIAAAVFGLAIAVAVGFWIYYGTAVFFQMVAAGFAACF